MLLVDLFFLIYYITINLVMVFGFMFVDFIFLFIKFTIVFLLIIQQPDFLIVIFSIINEFSDFLDITDLFLIFICSIQTNLFFNNFIFKKFFNVVKGKNKIKIFFFNLINKFK